MEKTTDRNRFFSVLGLLDDGRNSLVMTREEFKEFEKKKKEVAKLGKLPDDAIYIFFEFASYEDLTYWYSPSADCIYESRYYTGD